ncbi:MAG: diguanylate cyclase, partial [Myxococcales bacterium]|nr:diguanylate cyclase [Myxococcales bacterium]
MTFDSATEKGPVVLVVDDDETVRLLAQGFLGSAGFTVLTAVDGENALEQVNKRVPDLILLDVTLPGHNGFEVCAEFRERKDLEHVPIVMITGQDDDESVRKSYEVGANDFVAKPVNWLILVERALSLLRASRMLGELQDSRRQLSQSQRIAQLGSWSYDFDEEILWVSPEARRVIPGLPNRDLSIDDLVTRIHEEDRAGILEVFERGTNQPGYFSFEFRVPDLEGGDDRHIRACAERESGASVLSGAVQDVTEQLRAEEQIRFLAYHDSLTQLANRASFKARLSQAIERAGRHDRHVGLIFFDLDDFKRVNDTHGHNIGDQLLCEIASRLRSCVRGTDSVARGCGSDDESFVARLGGDEFTMVLEEVVEPQDLRTVAERIIATLPKPIVIDGHEFTVTGSMGLATWPQDGDDMETLLRKADVAMYQAKARGPGSYMFYSEALNTETQERVELEQKLHRAIDTGDMQIHYQPLARASDRRIIGCEALVRWSPPGLDPIGPDVFIPIAEEMGMIETLG